MGKEQSKIENPKANVVNEVDIIENKESTSVPYLLWIIISLLVMQVAIKIFLLHKKSLKRKYMTRAASLAQI